MARLGELERAVMDVLWSANGSCTAREIVAALPDRDLAATTVLTVLSRLERKDLVERDRDGRAHRYRPVASQGEHAAALMREALDTARLYLSVSADHTPMPAFLHPPLQTL